MYAPVLIIPFGVALVLTPVQQPVPTTPPAPAVQEASAAPQAFSVGDQGRRFDSADARDRLLAVHFLLATDCPFCTREIKSYTDAAPTIAGLRHIFVKNLSPEEFDKTLKEIPGGESLPLYRDADGALAKRFAIPGGYMFHGATMTYPAVVLLDSTGKEMYRFVGKSNTDRLAFSAFSAKVTELTRDSETAQANVTDGLGIQGYDPVAYLDQSKAVEGSKDIPSTYRGVTYRFASRASRDKFNASPEKYLPAYGGWCATAMADGRKVEINPKSFKVVGGRTFLFYKTLFGDALKDWNKDEQGLAAKADAHWKRLHSGR